MNGKAFFMTIPEFFLLVFRRNLTGLVLFDEIAQYVPDDRELSRSVVSLSEKGFFMPTDDDGYRISDEINEILSILERANSVFIVQGWLQESPMQCLCFDGENALSIQIDEMRQKYVRIEGKSAEDALQELTEYEFMPQKEDAPEGYALEPEAAYFPSLTDDADKLLEDEAVCLLMDRIPRGKDAPDLRISVVHGIDGEYIVSDGNGCTEVKPYCPEDFVSFVQGMMAFNGNGAKEKALEVRHDFS